VRPVDALDVRRGLTLVFCAPAHRRATVSIMADEMVIRQTWFVRVLRAVGLLPATEQDHKAGADYSLGQGADHQYNVASSMSAMAAFPWVKASVEAIASGLSSVPIRMTSGRGVDAQRVDDHPLLDLLDQPSSRVNGSLFRRQLATDLVLSGNAYALIIGDREPSGLLRLHPERVKAVPWADGQVSHYIYDSGREISYDHERVLHFRSTSWSADPSSLYGVSSIQTLHHDLSADLAASSMSAETAKRGRPTGVFSPATEGDIWSSAQVKIMREAYDRQLTGKSSALFLGGAAKYQALSFSPRDMEFQAQRDWVRSSTMAVFGVPPTILGLPTANFATSRQQAKTFWEGLRHRAAILDGELTRLARQWGDPTLHVWHDFSGVEALGESKTEQVNRVNSWWAMGLSLRQAAEMEGIDLPENIIEPEPEADEPEEVNEGIGGIRQLFIGAGETYKPPVTESERVALWRGFIDKAHGPRERALALTMRRELRARAKRTGERLEKMFEGQKSIKRDLGDTEWAKLIDASEEMAALSAAARKDIQRTLAAGFREAVKMVPDADLRFDPIRKNQEVERLLGSLVVTTETASVKQIRTIVKAGLEQGATIGQMQALIQQIKEDLLTSPGFSAARALTIARTETTRSVNAGALVAYAGAADSGIDMEVEWLTAAEGERHPSDPELAEQRVQVGQDFTSGLGNSGPGPGQLGAAEDDINCRCTVIPYFGD